MNIVTSVPDNLWAIAADESYITQLINHIVLKNAEFNQRFTMSIRAINKAMRNGEIPGLCAGKYVVLYVDHIDTQLTEEHLAAGYEHKNTLGFELSAAFSFIRNYNGTIRLSSKFGKGLSFTVYLPVSNQQHSATPHLQAA